MPTEELVLGYDPGGNGAHGVALLSLPDVSSERVRTQTFETTENVIEYVKSFSALAALGVDTLTCWGTGTGGWRPADRWLRDRYKDVRNSVMTPNRLAGSMGLNGMSVLIAARERFPDVMIVETHPKVLYWALEKKKHAYESTKAEMERMLGQAHAATFATANEHEWDAALSALAAARGLLGDWTHDLHALPTRPVERLITPCGKTNYYWPEF
jgi:predicted nuclease with RNAse H fold